jgi:Cupin-like domain
LKDYIAAIQSGSARADHYMRQSNLLHQHPELTSDIGVCEYGDPDRLTVPYLWLGPAGTLQPFHKDNHTPAERVENIFVQILGQKYIALVTSEDDKAMYARSPGSKDSHFSQVELQNVDRERFPKFPTATVHEAVIKPGDVLYIPSQTWHFVEALTPSLSLSLWWRSDDNGPRS